jgi:hypothetical protein
MNNTRILFLVLCIIGLIVWVLNGLTFFSLVVPHTIKKAPVINVGEVFISKALASTDSALKISPELRSPQFSSAMENPFKPPSEADPGVKRSIHKAPETQVKLSLKGVLLKAKPLAILEDAAGKTYICGVGETISEQRIESIEATRVTLKNNLGSYSLIVKE